MSSELLKKNFKPTSKCHCKKDVTPFRVELRLSCINIFGIWGKDFGVTSFFAYWNSYISVNIAFIYKQDYQ